MDRLVRAPTRPSSTTFYETRFRAEFKPAFDAWLATKPLTNQNAPLTPFVMPQYKLAAEAEAERLDAEAEVSAAQVRRNIQRASNYVLGVVLFSVVALLRRHEHEARTPCGCGDSRSGSVARCSSER